MIRRLTIFILVLLSSNSLYATTFLRLPLSEQLRSADAILVGQYLNQKSVLLNDGKLATQMNFKLTQQYGLTTPSLEVEEVAVHYPGGTWEGKTLRIEGIPSFHEGDKVVIFARSFDKQLWGLNLGLGSFRVVASGKENLLVNNIFPDDPNVGLVSFEDFEVQLQSIKGLGLKTIESQKAITSDENSQEANRSIASTKDKKVSDNDNSSQASILWPLLFIAIAGALASYRIGGRRQL